MVTNDGPINVALYGDWLLELKGMATTILVWLSHLSNR